MKRKRISVFLCFFMMGALMLSGCQGTPQESGESVRVIEIEEVGESENADILVLSGNVQPTETVKAAFTLAGKIKKIYPEEGDLVKQGEVIAALDPEDYALAEQAADSQESAAQAQLAAARAEYEAAALQIKNELPSKIAQAKAQLDLTQITYDRIKALYESEAVSKSQLDEVTAKLESDTQTYQQALDAVESARAKLNSAARQVDAYKAQAAAAGTQTEKTSKDLSDTTLKSPISGVVLSKLASGGEVTAAGYPVVVIGSIDDVFVEIGVADTQIGQIEKGMKATVSVYGDEESYTGRVEEIGSLADSNTRTFPVKLRVDNPERKLLPGMVAQVELPLDEEAAVLIPIDSVVQKASGAVVFVYDEESETVTACPVVTGEIRGNQIQILEGLQNGDQLVINGQYLLHDGDSVKLAEDNSSEEEKEQSDEEEDDRSGKKASKEETEQ